MADKYNSKIVLANGETLIDLTGDDVKPEHVKKDIYFHDKSGKRQQGTNTYTVDASEVTTDASEVLFGRKFGKGNTIETGTMPNRSEEGDVVIDNTDGVSIPNGYYDGSVKAKLSPTDLGKLVPSNIKKGEIILGVRGAYGSDSMSAQSKEVEPTFEGFTVSPESGFDFLTSVTVKPIKVTRIDNEAGGITVTIG